MGHGRPGWRRVTICADVRTDAPTEVPADLLVERPGGNYRPADQDHVRSIAARIAREGFRTELGLPVVRPLPDGRWEIVSGHHRIAALRSLGWAMVPVAVSDVRTDADLLADQVAENTCRKAAPITAEAAAFAELVAAGMDAAEIAERVGKPLAYVTRRLAVHACDPGVRHLADSHGMAWLDPLADLPGATQRELARLLDERPMTRAAWTETVQRYRTAALEVAAEQDALFGGDFGLSVQEWSTADAAYISDLLTEEPAVPVTVIRERVLGAADVAEHLGVKPDTVHKWGARRLLPPPDLMVSGAAAWWESTIDQWASERKAR